MPAWREGKQRYKRYKARTEQLPSGHREALEAVERYALRFGPATTETVLVMLEDLVETFEKGAEAGSPARDIVGDDPVRFSEELLKKHAVSPWAAKEQQRLARAVDDATRAEG